METLAATAIAIPLIGAAAVMAAAPITPRRARDLAGIGLAATTVALTAWLATSDELVVTWFGGWDPVADLAIGIAAVVDPVGAGVAALAGVLTTAALVFSWRYFEAVGALYHTLMLLFLGGMVGFALTGDLFNLFVFFELLTTAAYALTGYQVEREGPLQGALNFAVTNTVGAFLFLHGIAILYARTGALNLAEIGAELAGATPDLVLVASFTLLSAGLFTKAALVPFHFWLPDAHSVAPSPVSVLLSGVMIQVGLYGWARIFWTVFALPFGADLEALRLVVVVIGAVTALLAGVLALAQHHLKRLLAYSSVSHSGLILIGLGLLDARGVAGAGLYTLAHGAVKGALFLLAGIVLHRHATVDELKLHGRGRGQWVTAAAFALAGLGLAGLPPFGTALGKQLVEEAAHHHGIGTFVTVVFVAAGALTGGAVLRAAGRIFAGWGTIPQGGDDDAEDEAPETPREAGRGRTPAVMAGPAAALIAAAAAVTLFPGVPSTAVAAARLFTAPRVYVAAVMDGARVTLPTVGAVGLTATGVVVGVVAAVLAVLTAGVGLGRDAIPSWVRRVASPAHPALRLLRRLQSGHVGDYVAWLTAGTALLGGAYLLALR